MLPGATGQPRLVEGLFLSVEGSLAFDQEVRHLSIGDLHPNTPQQLSYLWPAHLRPKVQHQRQALDPRAELPAIALPQGRHGGRVLRRPVKFQLPDQHSVGAEEHIMHTHTFVAIEDRITWPLSEPAGDPYI